MLGYTVAGSPANTFWGTDLMHRLYHMPAIGQEWIEHYADDYEEVIELAAGNETHSTHDSDTIQFFAVEAYAYDIAVPGVGCAGDAEAESSSSESSSSTTSAVASSSIAAAPAAPASSSIAAAPAATTSATPTVSQAASATSELPAVSVR